MRFMFVFVPQSYRDKKKGLWKCSRSGGPLAGPTQLAAGAKAHDRRPVDVELENTSVLLTY
jgi:hypothetical protein